MRTLATDIVIEASAERVWRVLTDFDRYPEWNPFLVSCAGELSVGARLQVRASPSGSSGRTFYPTVTKVDRGREFRWLGRLLVPGLLDGEHIFSIERLADDRVRFVHNENFRGLVLPLHGMFRYSNTRRGFEEMNQSLKEEAESGPSQAR